MTGAPATYVGRFAPSPSGPLHFGSLLAALASYAQALVNQGQWIVRIEDIDPPREQPGADKSILSVLEAFGFEWQMPVSYQSSFAPQHNAMLARLIGLGCAYRCSCSRRDLADASRGPLGSIYPGTCRDACVTGSAAIRLRVDDSPVEFIDALQGHQVQRLESESGDFVIKRRDGLIAYHLAVVADDHHQGITEVVRGVDLLDSTPRQIYIQRKLGFSTPAYMHIPVAVDKAGIKLSKLTGATAITTDDPARLLCKALRCLNQDPPEKLARSGLGTMWRWIRENWDANRLCGQTSIPPTGHPYG